VPLLQLWLEVWLASSYQSSYLLQEDHQMLRLLEIHHLISDFLSGLIDFIILVY
jgi:hypothetical protein